MSREDYKKGTVCKNSFTDERVIQDFPIRGNTVYLHVRRCKWRDTEDGSVFTYDYDLAEEGSHYHREEAKATDYIFPLLSNYAEYAGYVTQADKDRMKPELRHKIYQDISSKNALIHKLLEKIAEKAEIAKPSQCTSAVTLSPT